VLSSIGFYPVNPSSGAYVFGSPLAGKTEISLPGNRKFVVKAKNVSKKNIYIQKATLNGIPYTMSWIAHADIIKGGELVFYMDSSPSKTWGTKPEDLPGK
jgi:putative alpha-1,2-mannosidase